MGTLSANQWPITGSTLLLRPAISDRGHATFRGAHHWHPHVMLFISQQTRILLPIEARQKKGWCRRYQATKQQLSVTLCCRERHTYSRSSTYPAASHLRCCATRICLFSSLLWHKNLRRALIYMRLPLDLVSRRPSSGLCLVPSSRFFFFTRSLFSESGTSLVLLSWYSLLQPATNGAARIMPHIHLLALFALLNLRTQFLLMDL
ncbi:hypothetical protein V8E53_015305 [Lactarius tabidus]